MQPNSIFINGVWSSRLTYSIRLGALAICCLVPICRATIAISADNVVIVLDDSGSMREKMVGSNVRRMEAAKEAIVSVLGQLKDDTNLGVRLLNGSSDQQHWIIPLGALSTNVAVTRIQSVRADGGTPLGNALREGADQLLKLREAQKYGVYRLLVVTDGEATDGNLLETYLPDVLSRGLIVDVIGVDMRQDHSLATRVHSYRRANDKESLKQAISEVLAEGAATGSDTDLSDFQLLDALDEQTAVQALLALSKPDSSPIGESLNKPETNSTFVVQPNQPPTGTGILGTFVATVLSCIVPIAILGVILLVVFSKGNKRRSGGFRN